MTRHFSRYPKTIFLCLLLISAYMYVYADDPITFTAQRVRSVYASGREQTLLSGNAHIKTGDIEINSDELSIYGTKQRYVESNGPVTIHDNKRNVNLKGDSLFYDRDTDILTLKGNTQLEDFKNEMLVRGGLLENRNKENIAIVQVGVRVFKKDISARCEMLVYRRDDDKVELSGLPVVYKKEDEYRASTIGIDLKTEEIQLSGKVKGTVQTKNDDKPAPGTTTTVPAPGTATTVPSPTSVTTVPEAIITTTTIKKVP